MEPFPLVAVIDAEPEPARTIYDAPKRVNQHGGFHIMVRPPIGKGDTIPYTLE
jgi:hypothetical protein